MALSGKYKIQSAKEMIEALQTGYQNTQINVMLIEENEIKGSVNEFEERCGPMTAPLPQLRKIHFVKAIAEGIVKYAYIPPLTSL